MNTLIAFITEHARHAPWVVFGAALLAGLNVPISIDLLVALSAILAATAIPHLAIPLYLSLLFGCIFSAWIAYWVGRTLGTKLQKNRLLSKPLSPQNMERVHNFYRKYGLWTYIIGRFIPFGVRNCIFMSTGMSRSPFRTFVVRDGIACFLWSLVVFPLFYSIGLNFESLLQVLKKFNLIIFSTFSMAIFGLIWYKKKRKHGKK